ncbi:MAG: ribose-phosphate pyrophosphokinase [Bacteroidales bacterium]|nr:ribose-phosphate pyrophosphokinase [Bacteroidales bacterium]MBQ1637983.1 ribose-phosphate pyrophosphokinase [Bacteroidales bacterium]MBQ2193933.1 ribose-phosphate pyrophosphokinase [Bacteroidales bacterium]MBQ4221739.1 ribose-phosphate pyrophosphokinase [Bacteroidales bacterium]MBQ5529354.1 ribose-phosphate pyrophosphokinase [Bacteroidales bacterium]
MQEYDHKLKLFACNGSRVFAEQIAQKLNTKLGDSELTVFSDGEFQPQFTESVRGSAVFIVQSTNPPADNLFELLLMIDAARRASAYKVIAVIPYFGWARQDRKDRPRVSIASKLVANMLTAAGCDRVMTCELHAAQIQGFFDIPVDHLWASSIFIPYIKAMNLDNLSIASPDMGGAKKANIYAKHLNAPLIICHKDRSKANVIGNMTAIGEIEGRNVVIVDDMVDTAGTITKCAEVLMERGALSVRAVCTHPILSGPAYDRINASAIQEFIVADTIPLQADKDNSKFTVLSMTGLFADVIDHIYHNEPVSDLFIRS